MSEWEGRIRTYVCIPAAATVVDAHSKATAAENLSSILGKEYGWTKK